MESWDADGPVLSIPLDGSTETDGRDVAVADSNVDIGADGHSVEFRRDSVLAFAADDTVRPDSGTISVEIEPDWSGSDIGDNSILRLVGSDPEQGQVWLRRRGKYLRFEWSDDQGVEQGLSVNIRDWEAGDRHIVTTTWNGESMSIYIDGSRVQTTKYDGQFRSPEDATMLVGTYDDQVDGADATLRNIEVYDREIGPHEVSIRSTAAIAR